MQTAVTRCFTNLRLRFSSKETPLRVLRPRQADVKSALISPRPQALTEGLFAQASCGVIASQSADWRGNPFPAPAGAESLRLPLRGRCHGFTVTEGEICRGSAAAYGAMWASPPTLRLPKAYTLSIRADRAVRPYNRLPYLRLILALSFRASDRCHWRGNPSPFLCLQRPKAATYLCRSAAKARFDNRPNPRRMFPKREGRSPPSLVVSRGKNF